jgi:DNA-binding LacI/PurR family transcriptional regulator
VDALVEIGLPAVVNGSPGGPLPAVWHGAGPPMTETVRYLAALGHTRLAYVAGVGEFVHAVQRFETFRASTAELGVHGEAVATDYTPESGARATRKLLLEPEPPTALIYDSPLLAVTGLGVVQHMGLAVPDDISIVGWDDSLISQVVHPPLTSITRDIHAYGVAATRRLLDAIEGVPGTDIETPRGELLSRASTARAPRP